MNITLSQCFLILIVVVPLLYFLWQHYYNLAQREVARWAISNKYELLYSKRCQWNLGPFQWKTIRGQEVYEFSIRDENNNMRKGWLRVNVPFLFGDKMFKAMGVQPFAVIWADGN